MTVQRVVGLVAGAIGVLFGCLVLSACGQGLWAVQSKKAASALFDERCKTEAGVKIYKTVQNVDGVLLLKVRPKAGENEFQDRYFPGAAFADEVTGDYYIMSFLAPEFHVYNFDGQKRVRSPNRGGIGFQPIDADHPGIPGYRYVEVIDPATGQRYRYTAGPKAVRKMDVTAPAIQAELKKNPAYDLNIYDYVLDKAIATSPPPRYAVTYEDHVVPQERAIGLASSTVKVIDTQTDEVLGEYTRYFLGGGFEHPSAANSMPWVSAYGCGMPDRVSATGRLTRQFVDQVLIPSKGE